MRFSLNALVARDWLTGQPSSKADLQKVARNIVNMTRAFNLQEGLQIEDDRLPKCIHKEALPTGKSLTSAEMEYMLQDYYRLRGWNELGIPAEG